MKMIEDLDSTISADDMDDIQKARFQDYLLATFQYKGWLQNEF